MDEKLVMKFLTIMLSTLFLYLVYLDLTDFEQILQPMERVYGVVNMWAFISVMCFLGSLACLLGAIIALFQKKGLHTKYFIISGALFVFFIVAIIAAPASPEASANTIGINVESVASNQPPVKETPKAVPYTIFEDNKSKKGPGRGVRVMTDAATEAEFYQIYENIRKDSKGFEFVWLYFHDTNTNASSTSGQFLGAVRFPLTQRGVALSGAKDINEILFQFEGGSPQAAKAKAAKNFKDYETVSKMLAQEGKISSVSPSIEHFKQAFNAFAKEIGFSHQINKIDLGVQAPDNFQVKFTNNLILNGAINQKDGSVREVFIAGVGDGKTDASGTDIILSIVSLIAATNPKLEVSEISAIITDLGLEGENVSDLNSSVNKNGIKYSLKTSVKLGVWFFAQKS
ncbi:hypothetical protein OB236_09830 [Paenibacillus sp. WQ 127069]|uniref:DUF4064 domain-containing protein n=1 Tax=Paenibacillus baimaensis TaxID=2982185 RepID=A0ABT2UCV4_9BACL|nr:hypothetical protein [Paenibacillus sp. WQ 127069]MCU6792427.1 hypothetical protein [Paenibacillus sp. WQ 127069]